MSHTFSKHILDNLCINWNSGRILRTWWRCHRLWCTRRRWAPHGDYRVLSSCCNKCKKAIITSSSGEHKFNLLNFSPSTATLMTLDGYGRKDFSLLRIRLLLLPFFFFLISVTFSSSALSPAAPQPTFEFQDLDILCHPNPL
jgi:hypothetical protein